jgi:hypothetical protein
MKSKRSISKRVKGYNSFGIGLAILACFYLSTAEAFAQTEPAAKSDGIVWGLKARAGARHDNIRMCVATPAGVKGGPAADISLYLGYALDEDWSIAADLPIFRPILFGAAFDMLQYEPDVSLLYRMRNDGNVDYLVGPSLGASFHYGPDYKSELSGKGRRDSFFAMGPIIGGYFGLDFKRPVGGFNFQFGLFPYVTPLFSINDPQHHRGEVIGALVDFLFKF